MNAGLSNLTRLKAAIMPPALRSRSEWDEELADLGRAGLEMMERHCDRAFGWMEDDVLTVHASRLFVSVPRFPVGFFTSVELMAAQSTSWAGINGSVRRTDHTAGLLHFDRTPGTEHDSLRVTYDGGFWWPQEEDESDTKPEGATVLPRVLFRALALQVQAMVIHTNLFDVQAAAPKGRPPQAESKSPMAGLLPAVESMLLPFRRFAA